MRLEPILTTTSEDKKVKDRRYIVIMTVLLLVTAFVGVLAVVEGQKDSLTEDLPGTLVPTATATISATEAPKVEPTATPTATPYVEVTATPTAMPIVTETPSVTPVVIATPTASPTATPKATTTPKPTATPTSGPTITPTPRPTVVPTVAPTSSPEVNISSVYDYVKNCGSYGTPSVSSLGYVGCYFLKSAVPNLTDNGIYYDSTWYVYIDQYEEMEEGYDCSIIMTSFGKETRDQVLELLKVVYPTGYAEVMDLVVKALRQEIWEYRWGYSNETPTAGTMGVRYIDGREVYIVMRNDLANLTIHIKDKGVVNPVVSQSWPQETVDYWTSHGTGNADDAFSIWFRKEYGL